MSAIALHPVLGRQWMIALFVGLVLVPRTSRSQGSSSSDDWLVWSAPPECPHAEHIKDQLRRWLGDDYDPARSEVTSSASVTWRDKEWTVKVRLRRGEDDSTRSVVVGSCTEAADFVALSVALLVNPEFLPDQRSESVRESPPPDIEVSGPGEEDESSVEPGPESASEEAAVTSAEPAESHFRLLVVSAGMGLRTGMFPSASPLAFARVGLRPGGWRMNLGVGSVPYLHHTPQDAQNPAVYHSLVGEGEVCRLWTAAAVAIGPCLGLEAGALSAQEKGGQPTALFWSAVQLVAGAELGWRWGGTFIRAGAQIPFTRPEFLLEGGTVVHQSKGGFDTKIGFSVFL